MGLLDKLKDVEADLKGLSKEEQEKKVNDILSTLSEDELEELKKQQCVFCLISEGKIESFDVYEDSLVKAVLEIKPANKGHVILFPKEHFQIMSMMPDELISHILGIANMLSKAVFEGVKAQGTNIYIANGQAAGQFVQHFAVNIIPRFKDDSVGLKWSHTKYGDREIDEVADKLRKFV